MTMDAQKMIQYFAAQPGVKPPGLKESQDNRRCIRCLFHQSGILIDMCTLFPVLYSDFQQTGAENMYLTLLCCDLFCWKLVLPRTQRKKIKNKMEDNMNKNDKAVVLDAKAIVYDREADNRMVLSVNDVKQQRKELERLYKEVLKKGVHYGTVEGIKKPFLWKSGSELINQLFRVVARYHPESHDLGNGHIRYETKCELVHVVTNTVIGEGYGVCSTMESGFRYRVQKTKKEIPEEWWKTKDPEVLGGPQYDVRKKGKVWVVVKLLEVAPADNWHKCKSQSIKRSGVAATRAMSACSDMFSQDDDLYPDDYNENGEEETGRRKPPPPTNDNSTDNQNENTEFDPSKKPSRQDAEKFKTEMLDIFGTEMKLNIFLSESTKGRVKNVFDIVSYKQMGYLRGKAKEQN
ncbi:MAG: hypothetical protein GTO45_20450 [Candidatus Aminicenantes bacterium]|nr:hypothetical protein [Candidatus Aminicenantes bacterium]NIN87132.1 hypothetical protein [Candidatus Aminicenantes bacterium]NIR09090.1 hypothetical protein [Candidatus Aminicenantes bacterium]